MSEPVKKVRRKPSQNAAVGVEDAPVRRRKRKRKKQKDSRLTPTFGELTGWMFGLAGIVLMFVVVLKGVSLGQEWLTQSSREASRYGVTHSTKKRGYTLGDLGAFLGQKLKTDLIQAKSKVHNPVTRADQRTYTSGDAAMVSIPEAFPQNTPPPPPRKLTQFEQQLRRTTRREQQRENQYRRQR